MIPLCTQQDTLYIFSAALQLQKKRKENNREAVYKTTTADQLTFLRRVHMRVVCLRLYHVSQENVDTTYLLPLSSASFSKTFLVFQFFGICIQGKIFWKAGAARRKFQLRNLSPNLFYFFQSFMVVLCNSVKTMCTLCFSLGNLNDAILQGCNLHRLLLCNYIHASGSKQRNV